MDHIEEIENTRARYIIDTFIIINKSNYYNNLDKDKEIDLDKNNDFITKLNRIYDKIGFSKLLYYIYLNIGQDNYSFELNEYTFYSIEEMEIRYNEFCNNGQTRVYDLAYIYLGMGHLKMLSLDITSKRIYVRRDGGSSGWDRQDNWNFCKDLDLSLYQDKLYKLDDFIEKKISDIDLILIN